MSEPPHKASRSPDVVIVTPVLDDWPCLGSLLDRVDASLATAALRAHVLVVDDGSSVPPPVSLGASRFRTLDRVDLVQLRVNLGHQRAIAVGLVHLEASGVTTPVVVMDADGEDRPEDLPRLLERAHGEPAVAVVFARREKRSEGLRFRALYTVYRWAHRALCGIDFRVGNFSCLAEGSLSRVVASPHLWNHYAGALLRSRLPHAAVGVDRGARISGRSRMNLPALVAHGLSSFAVHADIVGARLVIFSAVVTIVAALATVALLGAGGTVAGTPGWGTSAIGLVALALFQGLSLCCATVLVLLHMRSAATFLPLRDAPGYIWRVSVLYRAPGGGEEGSSAGSGGSRTR